MRPQHFVTLLVLLMLVIASAPTPAHAGGVVSVCDEAHLREALAGGGTVTFSCSGTITLTATITISADTTIDGSGQSVTLSGNHAVRVFKVNSGGALSLNRLSVTDGFTVEAGAGINSSGTLTVNDSAFFGNHVPSGPGGGIYNSGRVTVTNSIFSGNSALYTGGGIYNSGTLSVTNGIFSGNGAGYYGGGGAGIYNDGGTLIVSSSTFSNNIASGTYPMGGGINNNGGTLNVSHTTFSGNCAGGTYPAGGGVYNVGGTANLSHSAFSGNCAGLGGGIRNGGDGMVIVNNSTFSDNRAAWSGGIQNAHGTVTLRNTIVVNSLGEKNCAGFAITDGGGNLSYPDTTCPGINGDPKLGPLQDNGGPTWTMALLPGSAAIDAAIDAICAAPPVNGLDQRGVARPQGAHCDIGAYEAILQRAYLPIILR